MKKLLYLASCAALLASCTPKVPQADYDALKAKMDSVIGVNATMNEVIGSVNNAMTEMANDEGLIFVDDEGKDLKDKNAVLERMQAFRDHMARQREELAELKKKMSGNAWRNSELKKTIEALEAKIAEKDAEIAELQAKLEDSKVTINELRGQIVILNQAKQEVEADRNRIQEIANSQELELNTAYYVVDTKKNLKAAGLIEGVFKKKAKYESMDSNLFTKVDIREMVELTIASSNPKLITVKPAGTYQIKPNGDGTSTLTITDPANFWKASPYLIIQR